MTLRRRDVLALGAAGAIDLALGAGCSRSTKDDGEGVTRGTGPKGYGLTIGLNAVNPSHYSSWPGLLKSAEADADSMQSLLVTSGFEMLPPLRAKQATRSAVSTSISRLASKARATDLVCVYYAGHGGTVYDVSRDEERGRDQTWCLYDAQLIDDELHALCAEFPAESRVVFISDSCKSGSILMQAAMEGALAQLESTPENLIVSTGPTREAGGLPAKNFPQAVDTSVTFGLHRRSRAMPEGIAMATRAQNAAFYDSVVSSAAANRGRVKTRIELLAACTEMQEAHEDSKHGYFTGALLKTCGTACSLSYPELLAKVSADVSRRSVQQPVRLSIGPAAAWFDRDIALQI